MVKIARIESCEDCSEFSEGDTENANYCIREASDIVREFPDKFPDWCPLEDAHAWCPNCGKEFDSCGNCEAIFRTLPPGIEEE